MGETAKVSKSELLNLAETLAIFQRLPKADQIAIMYYIKGRVDAMLRAEILFDPVDELLGQPDKAS